MVRFQTAILLVGCVVTLALEPSTGVSHQTCIETLVTPPYPVIARRGGIFGTVEAHLRIDPSGRVDSVEIVRGHSLLRGYVQDALRQWTFCPSREETELNVTVTFVLVEPRTNTAVTTTVKAQLPHKIEVVSNLPEDIGPDVLPSSKEE